MSHLIELVKFLRDFNDLFHPVRDKTDKREMRIRVGVVKLIIDLLAFEGDFSAESSVVEMNQPLFSWERPL